jgi:malic enzyme
MANDITPDLESSALAYHRHPKPGKLEIQATKPLGNQRDLALAYSPGVAAACLAIAQNASEAASLTVRQNLVAVLSNGTAVLGLGDIGPRRRTSIGSSTSSRHSSRHSAASTWKISSLRNVLKSSASCANA